MKMFGKISGDQWLTQEIVDKPKIHRRTSKVGDALASVHRAMCIFRHSPFDSCL